ncbi:MAG: AhpC/TSA family protein [Odoribacteraceae bacterium]|jgi:thiol-disulfide isomerase/thioredoxin|nr:AhpC/TSA family protein [Odoribacteraceae bacterium]
MKKILLIAAVSGSFFAACNSRTGFTVNGTIESVTEGKALLVARVDNNTVDTIAIAPITNGAFTLEGTVKEVTPAILVIEGSRARVNMIFIENAEFTVKFGKDPRTEGGKIIEQGTATILKGGGQEQKVQNLLFALQQEYSLKNNELATLFYSTDDQAVKDSLRKVSGEMNEELKAKNLEIIKANPNAFASAYQIYMDNRMAGYEQLQSQLDLLGEKAKASTFGKMITERAAALAAVAIGQVAPDFTITTPEGDEISLHGIPAKVKLIDFWASWCGPCRGENPNVVKAYAEYHPKGLEIIGVSLDTDKGKWIEAIKQDQLAWKHGSDLKGWDAAVAKLYSVNAIPHTVLLDENNKIIAKNLRGDALKQKLAELLD